MLVLFYLTTVTSGRPVLFLSYALLPREISARILQRRYFLGLACFQAITVHPLSPLVYDTNTAQVQCHLCLGCQYCLRDRIFGTNALGLLLECQYRCHG